MPSVTIRNYLSTPINLTSNDFIFSQLISMICLSIKLLSRIISLISLCSFCAISLKSCFFTSTAFFSGDGALVSSLVACSFLAVVPRSDLLLLKSDLDQLWHDCWKAWCFLNQKRIIFSGHCQLGPQHGKQLARLKTMSVHQLWQSHHHLCFL